MPILILYGPFAIEKGKTAKKFFFELIVILDIFQPKNHIWHININFIFLAVSPLSIAKGPYYPYMQHCEFHMLLNLYYLKRDLISINDSSYILYLFLF